MPAFVWKTNHRMWKIVPPFADSLDVLKAYITHPSGYVYWSTPRLHDEIAAGDTAYIFCTVDNEGIVACGRIEETPRLYTQASLAAFAQPAQLTPPGWDESVAPSFYKTGIRITHTFWDAPITAGFRKPAQGTVSRISEADEAALAQAVRARG